MRKFFIKSIALILIVAGILFLSSEVFIHSKAHQIYELSEREWIDTYHTMPDQINVAVFGASHAHLGFRSAPEGKSFFNFALSGQMPYYDYMQMRQFSDRIAPGALVILTISYPSPYWPTHDNEFTRKQPRYYHILDPEQIVDFDPVEYCLHKYFDIMAEDLQTMANAILRPDMILAGQDGGRRIDTQTLPSQQEAIIDGHWGSLMPSFPDTNPDMMDAYRQMLTMCRDNGWQAVLVTPPYLEEYNDCFPEEFFPAFYEAVDSLSQEFDVPYLDYSHDEAYFGRYDLYRDIDHLNADGAEVFDAQFFADLQTAGIWE